MSAYDAVVIGAGVFGAWTAWHLGRAGKRVLLVDAWGPGHSRSSSGGESRIIRMGYGGDEIYTRMAMRSFELWRAFFESTGFETGSDSLFHRTGVLWVARQDDPRSAAMRETLGRAGVTMETFSRDEMVRRFPQMRVEDPRAYGIFEPDSGVLMARRAVAAVVQDAVRLGVEYQRAAVRGPVEHGFVRTTAGQEIRANVFIFSCGPWLPKLFPDLLGNRLFCTRQEVFFFAPPAGDPGFGAARLPVWLDFTDARGPYGFPDLESRGFKLAFDRHGPAVDPDANDRRVSAEGTAEARRFLAERFPALRDAPLAESRVCQYENTSNGDFLIDRHPEFENVWLVGGGSGHGFKHGPAVGEYVRGRILKDAPAERRFLLETKGETLCRTVY